MNCDLQLGPRFSCLPLGLSQWNQQRTVMQKAYEIGLGLVNGRSDHTDLQRAKRFEIFRQFFELTLFEKRTTVLGFLWVPDVSRTQGARRSA